MYRFLITLSVDLLDAVSMRTAEESLMHSFVCECACASVIFKIQVYLSKLFYVLQNVLCLSLASNHPINTMNERTEQTNKKTKKQRRMRRRRKNICERALTCIHNYTHTYTNRRRRRRLCQLNRSWTGSKASWFGCCCCWLVCLPSLQIFKCVLATFSFCV